MRAVAPDAVELASWTAGDYIEAALYDLTAKVHFKNPKPYPRPADAIRQRRRDEARHAALLVQQQRIKSKEAGWQTTESAQ